MFKGRLEFLDSLGVRVDFPIDGVDIGRDLPYYTIAIMPMSSYER